MTHLERGGGDQHVPAERGRRARRQRPRGAMRPGIGSSAEPDRHRALRRQHDARTAERRGRGAQRRHHHDADRVRADVDEPAQVPVDHRRRAARAGRGSSARCRQRSRRRARARTLSRTTIRPNPSVAESQKIGQERRPEDVGRGRARPLRGGIDLDVLDELEVERPLERERRAAPSRRAATPTVRPREAPPPRAAGAGTAARRTRWLAGERDAHHRRNRGPRRSRTSTGSCARRRRERADHLVRGRSLRGWTARAAPGVCLASHVDHASRSPGTSVIPASRRCATRSRATSATATRSAPPSRSSSTASRSSICGAGHADLARTQPWERDTIVNVYSCTKGMTALCAHRLVVARAGSISTRRSPTLLAGVRAGRQGRAAGALAAQPSRRAGGGAGRCCRTRRSTTGTRCAPRSRRETPWWKPGTAHGYHAVTFGWLVGEVVRRITGKSLGTYFREEIAEPLGARLPHRPRRVRARRVAEMSMIPLAVARRRRRRSSARSSCPIPRASRRAPS